MPNENETKIVPTTKKIFDAFVRGAGIMFLQAPIVNGSNGWSVAGCRYNLSDFAALKFIYQGKVNSGKPSVLNFGAGMGGHLSKEVPRLLFKSTGLYLYKPWLNTQLAPNQADLAFAATLSVSEIFINPADTWRVNIQAGAPLERSLQRLYAGSLANGFRQFGTWWGFGYSNRKLNDVLQKHSSIDPRSYWGMAIKAYPQSIFFTSMVYTLERIKNELQYNKDMSVATKNKYVSTASHIWQTAGIVGFFRGFHPKVLSNSVLAFGANALLEMGQRQLKSK